jgi:hypothetical protein
LLGACAGGGADAGDDGGQPAAAAILPWPDELSGAALLPDGRLLLVDDEERRRVFLVELPAMPSPITPTAGPAAITLPIAVNDLEAATTDRRGQIYLLTSHSPTKKGKVRPTRRLLLRCRLTPAAVAGGAAAAPAITSLAVVRDLLKVAHHPELRDAPYNFEGLAWYPADGDDRRRERLLIGVRTPMVGGRALVIAIGPPDALLAGEPVEREIFELELGGRGIRGLAYDPWREAVLILAGPIGSGSLRPGPPYAVFRWDPTATAGGDTRMAGGVLVRRVERGSAGLQELAVAGLEALPQPEAICAAGPPDAGGAGPIIIVTEGRTAEGPPVIILEAKPRHRDGDQGS